MREVVKTLKQFAEQKKLIEKENEKLRADIDMVMKANQSNNPNQKIMLHMKIKEENN